MNMKDDIEQLTKKYQILASAIDTSLKAYQRYYEGIREIFFNKDGSLKMVDGKDNDGNIIKVPVISVVEFPKLVQINDIIIKPDY